MTILNNCVNGIKSSVSSIPSNAFYGALAGFVSATFAGLPVKQAMIAYSINSVARGALDSFLKTLFNYNPIISGLSRASLAGVWTYFSIRELEKRGLMGSKLKTLTIAVNAILVATSLYNVSQYAWNMHKMKHA